MKRIDILNLEWPGSDRDRHISTPVYLRLRRRYGLKVVSGNMFNGYGLLLRHRPKMLLVSNAVGAIQNHEIALFAKKTLGIKVVSLVSEGNMADHNFDSMFWGWNREKEFFNDATILWTERTRDLIIRRYPELAGRLFVSGNTGFDRYKLLNFLSREQFLRERGLNRFKRVIGVCGWGFDRLFGAYFEAHRNSLVSVLGMEQIEMHRRDMVALRGIYGSLISSMPDTLFILRYHPGCMNPESTEFAGLHAGLPNVLISGPGKRFDAPISDVISVSDAWIGYETTTAMEAWLLNKPVFFINPSGPDFLRPENHRGVCVSTSLSSLEEGLAEYFETGRVGQIDARSSERTRILRDTIGYWDGRCHERAAEVIYRVFADVPARDCYGGLKIQAALALRAAEQGLSNLKHYLRTGKSDRLLPDTATINHYENLYGRPSG